MFSVYEKTLTLVPPPLTLSFSLSSPPGFSSADPLPDGPDPTRMLTPFSLASRLGSPTFQASCSLAPPRHLVGKQVLICYTLRMAVSAPAPPRRKARPVRVTALLLPSSCLSRSPSLRACTCTPPPLLIGTPPIVGAGQNFVPRRLFSTPTGNFLSLFYPSNQRGGLITKQYLLYIDKAL